MAGGAGTLEIHRSLDTKTALRRHHHADKRREAWLSRAAPENSCRFAASAPQLVVTECKDFWKVVGPSKANFRGSQQVTQHPFLVPETHVLQKAAIYVRCFGHRQSWAVTYTNLVHSIFLPAFFGVCRLPVDHTLGRPMLKSFSFTKCQFSQEKPTFSQMKVRGLAVFQPHFFCFTHLQKPAQTPSNQMPYVLVLKVLPQRYEIPFPNF